MKKYILTMILVIFSIESFGQQSNPYVTNGSGSNRSLVVKNNPVGQSLYIVDKTLREFNYSVGTTYIDKDGNNCNFYILGYVKAGDNVTPDNILITYKDNIVIEYIASYDSIMISLFGGWKPIVDYCLDRLQYMFNDEKFEINTSDDDNITYEFYNAIIDVNKKENHVIIVIY